MTTLSIGVGKEERLIVMVARGKVGGRPLKHSDKPKSVNEESEQSRGRRLASEKAKERRSQYFEKSNNGCPAIQLTSPPHLLSFLPYHRQRSLSIAFPAMAIQAHSAVRSVVRKDHLPLLYAHSQRPTKVFSSFLSPLE